MEKTLNKPLQIIKLWWMGWWRFSLVEIMLIGNPSIIPFLASGALAFVLVLVRKCTVLTWPLVRVVLRKPVIIDEKGPANSAGAQQPQPWQPTAYAPPPGFTYGQPTKPAYNPPRYQTPPQTQPASNVSRGGSHEFTPRTLEKLPVPSCQQMFGVPGKSLASATGMSASSASAGALGETNFAKALAISGLLTRAITLWSVHMPAKRGFGPDPVLDTDIDCVMFFGNTILLLDMKLYVGGEVTYTSQGNQLIRIDNHTRKIAGRPITMSRNMEIAQERFKALYPRHSIYSMVVFMPTDRGSATLDNVVWPGGIPAVNLDEVILYLRANLPQGAAGPEPAIRSVLPLVA